MKGFKIERATPEELRWLHAERLCKRYGWTLEYALSLDARTALRLNGVLAAEADYEKIEAEKRRQLSKGRGRRRR